MQAQIRPKNGGGVGQSGTSEEQMPLTQGLTNTDGDSSAETTATFPNSLSAPPEAKGSPSEERLLICQFPRPFGHDFLS